MWNHADSNKIIGIYMKIEAYKHHKQNLSKVKSNIKMSSPWKSPFQLSRFKNRYQKSIESRIEKENKCLIERMIRIDGQPYGYTINNIPLSIPSNPQTFSEMKERERKNNQSELQKKNLKILEKIQNASSEYGKSIWQHSWKNLKKYRKNISRKQTVPDFSVLVKQYTSESRALTRPSTALPI